MKQEANFCTQFFKAYVLLPRAHKVIVLDSIVLSSPETRQAVVLY